MTEHHSPRGPHRADPLAQGRFWFDEHNLPWRPRRMRRGIHGNQRLARRADLAAFLAPSAPSTRLPYYALLVEGSDDGAVLDPILWDALHLPEEVRTRHLLAVGQTGCGKTTRLILPLLLDDLARRRTVIAIDAKGRKLHPVAQRLVEHFRPGQKAHLLNFRDPERGGRWDPLAGIRTRGDAHAVAHRLCTLVDRGGEKDGVFWLNNSIDLLMSIILALKQDGPGAATLGRAHEVAQMSFYDLARFTDEHPDVEGLARICELHSDAHQTGACVLQDLRMRLSTFMDERIVETTSGGVGAIDLDELLLEGGVLVLEVHETDVGRLRQVLNLFVNQLFERIIELSAARPDGRLPVPCSLFLDEFASAVGRIDDMEVRLNTVRERGVSIVAAVQSLSQLRIYGGAAGDVLAGFGTKLFFAGLEWGDAEYASRLAGQTTVSSAAADEDEGPYPMPHLPIARPVLLPEEVARPVRHAVFGSPSTLFLPEVPPVQVYLRPGYDLPVLARAMEGEGIER